MASCLARSLVQVASDIRNTNHVGGVAELQAAGSGFTLQEEIDGMKPLPFARWMSLVYRLRKLLAWFSSPSLGHVRASFCQATPHPHVCTTTEHPFSAALPQRCLHEFPPSFSPQHKCIAGLNHRRGELYFAGGAMYQAKAVPLSTSRFALFSI